VLHFPTQCIRLELERASSPVRVFEIMAPLVDSPFSTGVTLEQKVSPADAVSAELGDQPLLVRGRHGWIR
jgi:uncharacterized oxidoreductase